MDDFLYDSLLKHASAVAFITDFAAESLNPPDLTFPSAGNPAPHKLADRMKKGAYACDKKFKPMFQEIGEVRHAADQSDACTAPTLICFAGGRPTNCTLGEFPQNQAFTFVKNMAGVLVRLDDEVAAEPTVQTAKNFENQQLGFRVIVALNETEQRERTAELLRRGVGGDCCRSVIFDSCGP